MRTSYFFAFGLSLALPSWSAAQPLQPLQPSPQPPGAVLAPDPAPAPPAAPAPAPAPPLASPAAPPVTAGPAAAPLAPSFVAADTSLAASTAPGAEAGADEAVERPSDALPSLTGQVGLFRLSAAEVGRPGDLRIGFHGEYFSASNFLVESDSGNTGDRNLRLQGALMLAFTPLKMLELFGGFIGSANRNRRLCDDAGNCTPEMGRSDPDVIKAYGDILLGSKFAYPLSGGVSAGGELGVKLHSSVSGLSVDPDATSLWLSGLATWNARTVADLPLRVHLNLGLYLDNSYNLQEFGNVGLASRVVSSFAYGMGRDRFRTGLGAEWAFDLGQGLSLRPFGEYHLEVITAEADPAFNQFREPACRQTDTCRDNRDQQWFTLGVRGQTPGGLAVGLGMDISAGSVGFPYGPPLPPYNIVLGVTVPLDVGGPRVITRTVTVEKPVPAARPVAQEGFVSGKVISARGGAPVEGAIVGVVGRGQSRVATDPDGTFRSPALPSGPVELQVTAPGFEATSVRANVMVGQPAEVLVSIKPSAPEGRISGRLVDESGKGVQATIKASGPQNLETKSDEAGNFSIAAAPGSYVVRVVADRHLNKEARVTLTQTQPEAQTNFTVRSRPAIGSVTVREGRLVVRQPFTFKQANAQLPPSSEQFLDELADALVSNPEKKLRIETHWDSSLPKDRAQKLTDEQAQAIAAYLARQGVSEDRIVANGLGSAKPLVPNIGRGRLKNRRVDLQLVN